MLALGVESLSVRFHQSLKTTNQAITKYGKVNVSVTGHSLGGTQALYANSKTGVKAVAFNPGASIPQAVIGIVSNTLHALFDKKVGKNAYIFTSGADLISLLSHFEYAHHYQVNATNGFLHSHALKNFLTDG